MTRLCTCGHGLIHHGERGCLLCGGGRCRKYWPSLMTLEPSPEASGDETSSACSSDASHGAGAAKKKSPGPPGARGMEIHCTGSVSREVEDAMGLEVEDARSAGALGFYARLFCQTGMPHRRPDALAWERFNGHVYLSMVGSPRTGLPYGKVPRQLVLYLTTAALRVGRNIDLGSTLSAFLRELGLGSPTGGRNGSATRLRDQVRAFFACTVSATLDFVDPDGVRVWEHEPLPIGRARLCWHPREPDQIGLWSSFVELSEAFHRVLTERPVPVDRRAFRDLRSSLDLDVYAWLTYRMSYLRVSREIPFDLLSAQFGACYASRHEFRRALLESLRSVLLVYPEARVEVGKRGLLLHPSSPHVPLSPAS